MNMERERLISVPLTEYKDLLSAKAELEIIYHKLESCTGTTEKSRFTNLSRMCMRLCTRRSRTLRFLFLSFRVWLNRWLQCALRTQ